MSNKIRWSTDELESNVTKIYIYSATAENGGYVEVTNIAATSNDGNNNWIGSYVDLSGTDDDWYKIKFYDSVNYSDYSDPMREDNKSRLCSVDDVKRILDTVGRWDDEEVLDFIDEADEVIYLEMGDPISRAKSYIDNNYGTYYVGERNVYRIDNVYYGTTTKRQLVDSVDYTANAGKGMIHLATSDAGVGDLSNADEVFIEFVPGLYNKLSALRTAKLLIEKTDVVSGQDSSRVLSTIDRKLEMIEQLLVNKIGPVLSSQYTHYDPRYKTNEYWVTQDHDKNKYY